MPKLPVKEVGFDIDNDGDFWSSLAADFIAVGLGIKLELDVDEVGDELDKFGDVFDIDGDDEEDAMFEVVVDIEEGDVLADDEDSILRKSNWWWWGWW